VAGAPAARDVGLERPARAVEAVAHELDRESDLRPVAVHLVAGDVDVRPRRRQGVSTQQVGEAVLERAERDVVAQGEAQAPSTWLARVARDARVHVRGRRAVMDPRLVARSREVGERQPQRHVEQDARRRGDADPVVGLDVQRVQLRDPMDVDARLRTAGRRRHGDLETAALAGQDSQQLARREMAQRGAVAAREHCGHPGAVP
jgi:hypothetical protein